MAFHLPEQPNQPTPVDSFYWKGWFKDIWNWIKRTSDISPVKTATFYVADCNFYPVNSTSGNITVNLPACVGIRGRSVVIKKTVAANTVTITPNGTDTIEGGASYAMTAIGNSVEVVCDGISNWYIRGLGGSSGFLASPLTTKGDIWGYSALDARIPVGANDYVLMADSTQALGVKWAAMPFMSAGSLYLYKADTSALSGYPGDGDILWDNATQISATHLIFAHLTRDNLDVDRFLELITSGSTILIQDANDSANYQTWTTSGAGVNTNGGTATSYWTYPVTFVTSGGTGTTNFPNNHNLYIVVKGSGGGGTPGGADTQVQFNDAGSFGGDADFTWDKTTNTLTFGTASKVAVNMTAATQTDRFWFTNTVVNGNANLGIYPNGTGTTALFRAVNNSTVTAALSMGQFGQEGTVTIMDATILNAGTQGTLELRIGGTPKVTVATTGNVTFANDVLFTGDITKIRNQTTTFPAANAVGMLTNNGSGTLTWTPAGASVTTGITIGQTVAIMNGLAGP